MSQTRSFLRREEYKALSSISLDGRILDVGGSKKSGYHKLLGGDHEIVTANINASFVADVIFDAEKTWPLENASFDAVLFLNVLEHLYSYRFAISEAHRVLRTGGRLVGTVPFLFNVHGSPNDYFRFTRTTLERTLSDYGFSEISVRELGSGAFGVVYHCLIGIFRWNWLATLGIAAFSTLDRLVTLMNPDNQMSSKEMPLGYCFEARRL